jgi:hypothetical protein
VKQISTEARVDDLAGLLADLKAKSFSVLNVAADARGTYVYLDEAEEKDPVPIVLEWVGKPAPPPLDLKTWKKRVKAAKTPVGEAKSLFRRFFGLFARRKTTDLPLAAEPPSEIPPPATDPKFFRKIL